MCGRTRRSLLAGIAAGVVAAAGCASGTTVSRGPVPFPQPSLGPTEPAGPVEQPLPATVLSAVLETALSLEGRPYRYGGADPLTGFDCSGFVWYVFAAHAVDLPRTTAAQYEVGESIELRAIAAGDLVFFSTTAPGPSHVGIALDAHTLIHAPSTGSSVRVERFDTAYWRSHLTGVRRVERPPQG